MTTKHARRTLRCSWCLGQFVSRAAPAADGPWCSRHCMSIARIVAEREAQLPVNAALVITAESTGLHPVNAREFATVGDFLVELDDRLELLPPSPLLDALREHRDALFATWTAMTAPEPRQHPLARLEEVA